MLSRRPARVDVPPAGIVESDSRNCVYNGGQEQVKAVETVGEGLCLVALPKPTRVTVLSLTGQHLLQNRDVPPRLLTALISGDINVHKTCIRFHTISITC